MLVVHWGSSTGRMNGLDAVTICVHEALHSQEGKILAGQGWCRQGECKQDMC